MAPLHQPHNLAPIKAIAPPARTYPQVACFDTAFHQRSQPHSPTAFALPRELSDAGIRRYGFHGLSYDYVSSRLRESPPIRRTSASSSLTSETAQPVRRRQGQERGKHDGLHRGRRPGYGHSLRLDRSRRAHLFNRRKGHGCQALETLVYKQCGLLGVSGISSDMRTLRASDDPRAKEAIDLFIYRIVREIGSLAHCARRR